MVHSLITDYGNITVHFKGNFTKRVELVKRVKMGHGFISLFPNVRHPMHHKAIIKGQIQNIPPVDTKKNISQI